MTAPNYSASRHPRRGVSSAMATVGRIGIRCTRRRHGHSEFSDRRRALPSPRDSGIPSALADPHPHPRRESSWHPSASAFSRIAPRPPLDAVWCSRAKWLALPTAQSSRPLRLRERLERSPRAYGGDGHMELGEFGDIDRADFLEQLSLEGSETILDSQAASLDPIETDSDDWDFGRRNT